MSYAETIINKFGGTRKAASTLNLAPSTVQSWKDAGFIPARHQRPVWEKARELHLDVSQADFFAANLPPSREKSKRPKKKKKARKAA